MPPKLRHYHSPDDLSWDKWRLSDSEVGRIHLENAASPEEADEPEETTADEMAVDGSLDDRLKVKAVLLNSTLFNLSIEQN